ncbi:hypothetical protein [Egicoccus halophilus]|uniref:YndJ-like protein n=1 Tax=Egicoccus halophilus TaxID=1670830 RepID=A0A8J3EU06_9ACTN|nr:hypothetical protein [Egicoccus halophilus]GGI04955.1 hypothetical protein GCM10011354_11670 [Egicoccus halophilus]
MTMRRVELRGSLVDRVTQRWVIATGRRVDLVGGQGWLDGPVGDPGGIGDRWVEAHAARHRADVVEGPEQGLLPRFAALTPSLDVAAVSPHIAAFYETTAAWSVDVSSRWARWAEPGGRLINAVFARRLRQLSLPLDPLDVAQGMDSRVAAIVAPDGDHLGTVWQRTLRATGATVFGGFYGACTLPGAAGPSVRVVFPLPNGSLTVFLRPEATPDSGLVLSSKRGRFGEDGAYLVVRPGAADQGWARRVPLHERFALSAGRDGSVRCDHRLDLGPLELLRLRYRLRRHPTGD